MRAQLRPALVMIALFTLLTGVIVPLGFVAVGHVLLPFQAGGSLIRRHGQVIGSALIGQDFTAPGYFQGRPSALMGPDPKDAARQIPTPYDASESGASNLAPTSTALLERVRLAVAQAGPGPVPGDMLTSSASGLDPDISPQTALRQVARVARARGLAPDRVKALVTAHIEEPALGFLGAARVNVLRLNLALDGLARE